MVITRSDHMTLTVDPRHSIIYKTVELSHLGCELADHLKLWASASSSEGFWVTIYPYKLELWSSSVAATEVPRLVIVKNCI